MKPRSAKNKGVRLQNMLRDALIAAFPSLELDDVKPALMGEGGEDIKLSPAARKQIPWAFECKNTEALNVWKALEQAEANSKKGRPALVFKRNRSKIFVAIHLEDFLQLVKGAYEKKVSE